MNRSRAVATVSTAVAALLVSGVVSVVSVVTDARAGAAARRPAGSPLGHLDAVTTRAGVTQVSGWAADPGIAAPVRVTVRLDGTPVATALTTGVRKDVARRHPGLAPQTGFTVSVTVVPGSHTVCVDVVNVGAGADATLACRTVTVRGTAPRSLLRPVATRAPFGHLDAAGYRNGTLTFSGWSIDPDTTDATLVDLTMNSVVVASVAANAARRDVARAHPRYGTAHGLRAALRTPRVPGNYLACATAINTAVGPAKQLGCALVTVLPSGEPATLGTASAAAAANAIQAQAIASGAARAKDFPRGASSAARLAIATRALLQQAVGRGPRPPANPSVPAFRAATAAKPVDEQAVMGRTPNLGTYPAARSGGRTGPARSLEDYARHGLPVPAAVGDGLVGAAPVLPANGTTVRPKLPAYPASHRAVRAEVAVDAALSLLGVPYVYAAAGPDGYDCSGLTEWAWAKAGVDLYHYTGTQARQGVRVKPNQLLPGDLLLFGSGLHHVGLYLGAGYLVHAPYTGAYVRVDKVSALGDFTLAVRP